MSATPGWMYSVREDSHSDILANANAAAAMAMQRLLGLPAVPKDAFNFFLNNLATINRAGRTLKQPPNRQQLASNPTDRLVILDHTNCFLFYCSSVAVPKDKLFALPDLSQAKNPLAVLSCIAALERQLSLIAPITPPPAAGSSIPAVSAPPATEAKPVGAALTKVLSAEKKTPVSSGYADSEDASQLPVSDYVRPGAPMQSAPPKQSAKLASNVVASYGDQVSPDNSPLRARPSPVAAVPKLQPTAAAGYGDQVTPPSSPDRSIQKVQPKPSASAPAPVPAKAKAVAAAAGYGDAGSPPSSPDHPIIRNNSGPKPVPPGAAPKQSVVVNYGGDDEPVPVAKPQAKASTPVAAKPKPTAAVSGYGDAGSPPSSPDHPIIRNSGPKSVAAKPQPKPTAAAAAGYGDAETPPSAPPSLLSQKTSSVTRLMPASEAVAAKPKAQPKPSAVAGYGDAGSPPSSPDQRIVRSNDARRAAAPAATPTPTLVAVPIAAKPKAAVVSGYGDAGSPPSSPDRPIIRNSGPKPTAVNVSKKEAAPALKKAAAAAGYGDQDSPPSSPDRPIIRSSGPKPAGKTKSVPTRSAAAGYGDQGSPPSSPDRPIVRSSVKAAPKAAAAAGYGDQGSPPSSPDRPIIRSSAGKGAGKSAKPKKSASAAAGYGDQDSPPSSPDRPIVRSSSSNSSQTALRGATHEQLLQSAASYGAAASPPPADPKLAQKMAQFQQRSPRVLDAGYRDVDDSGAPSQSIVQKRSARPTGKADLSMPDANLLHEISAAFNRPRVRIALAPAVLSLAAGHYGQRLFMEMRPKFQSATPTFEAFMSALYETFGFKDKRDRAPAAEIKELEDCIQGFLCNGNSVVSAEDFGNFVSFFGPCYKDGRDLIDNMFDLLSKRWLHPTTDNEVVNRLLQGERPGSFLVRMSRERGSFVVCVRYPGDVKQFKVARTNEGFRLADGVSAPSMQDLVVLLRAQPLVYPLPRTRLVVNAPVASGVDLVRPEPLAMKAARAVAEAWWRYPAASRYLPAAAQAILAKAITTHYIPRSTFLLEHFAYSSGEQLGFMMRDPRLVRWWTENGAKCSKGITVVQVPAWAALVATEFGLPYQELCIYLTAVLNDFANTVPGDLLQYDMAISHISRFHLTFSCPATSWNEWFIELKALLSKPWFFGTLSTAEAASLLAQQPVGTFLIRFSAPPGALAIGSVTPGGVVKHFKILHEPGKKYVIGETTECLTLDEVLGLADRMCHCKVPLSSPRKFRQWLTTPAPEPPAAIMPRRKIPDDYHPSGAVKGQLPSDYGKAQAPSNQMYIPETLRASAGQRDYTKASLYGDEAGISQSPPREAPKSTAAANMYGSEAHVEEKPKAKKAAKKAAAAASGYGDAGGDSGNESSPWEDDPNYTPPVADGGKKEDDGGESSPWDDDVTPAPASTKPAPSDYVRSQPVTQPPPSDYVRGNTSAPAPVNDGYGGPPSSDYGRTAQAPANAGYGGPPPSDYVRGNTSVPVSSGYGTPPPSDYARAGTAATPPSDYTSARNAAPPSIFVDGRGPSALGAPPTISYPHSDEDKGSPAGGRYVAGQTHLSASKR